MMTTKEITVSSLHFSYCLCKSILITRCCYFIAEVDGPNNKVVQFKGKLLGTFNCELKDEHKVISHFVIFSSKSDYHEKNILIFQVKIYRMTLINNFQFIK